MSVRVRFPNQSTYIVLKDFKWGEFRVETVFEDCVFGWYGDTYVCIHKEDYEDNRIQNDVGSMGQRIRWY